MSPRAPLRRTLPPATWLQARCAGHSTLMGRRFLLLPAESEDELSRGVGVLVSPVAAAQSRFFTRRRRPLLIDDKDATKLGPMTSWRRGRRSPGHFRGQDDERGWLLGNRAVGGRTMPGPPPRE